MARGPLPAAELSSGVMTTPGNAGSAHHATATGDHLPYRYGSALAQTIESRWQDIWESRRVFEAPNPGQPGFDAAKAKKYILDMFPYPSGVGLHVGHPLGYIATDIFARFLRMTGHNVLHTMGFDSFGLPAEQYAVQTGQHPRITTENNIRTMKAQLRRLGLGHDPRRSVSTTDTAFYKWTQWIFLQIYNAWYDAPLDPASRDKGRARPIRELFERFERGDMLTACGKAWAAMTDAERRAEIDARRLAFRAEVPVNWCPMLGTVLANEEVTSDGRSERGNFPVYKRPLKQWMMRITCYADRLSEDLEHLDWPEAIKILQRNWIGRSSGAYVHFRVEGRDPITVFTTRPDTLFGATYIVLSPDHPLVNVISTADRPKTSFRRAVFPGADDRMTCREAVAAYRLYAGGKSEADRASGKDKTGVFTGAYAINPVNDEHVPIFIADYVLGGYGTGAIMAVPAHDDRDFEFAQAMKLPIRDVVYPRPIETMLYFAKAAYGEDGEPGPNWRDELADLLGLATNASNSHQSFDAMLDIVRTRRFTVVPETPGMVAGATPEGPACDVPGSLGQRRGTMRAVWLETIDNLGFMNFNDMRRHLLVEHNYQLLRGQAFTEPGVAVHSASAHLDVNHLPSDKAADRITKWLEHSGHGAHATTYKLRDWLFSRQRYWGEPFPIVYDKDGVAHDLPEAMLPVLLPELKDFQPESSTDPDAPVRTPLNRAAEWVECELDLGNGRRRYTRETNTMPNWAGSCWYYLRYLDPVNAASFCDSAVEHYWMAGTQHAAQTPLTRPGGVDLYVGGVEHAVLHLLYARFWHKVLFDLGHVSTPEPFQKLFNQGYIQAYAYKDARGIYVDADKVTLADGSLAMDNQDKPGPFFFDGQEVTREYGKMGKSLRNAVGPDDICTQYGCDTLRLYEMSMGPLEASKPWNTRDIAGPFRFLQRLWRNLIDEQTGASHVVDGVADRDTLRALHKTIIVVRRDMQAMSFNTVVSKLIELNNRLSPGKVTMDVARAMILMLAPLAPHMADELWYRVVCKGMGEPLSIAHEAFPVADPELAKDDEIEVPISVMGRPRHRIRVVPGLAAAELEAAAMADPKVQELIAGKVVKKIVVVPGKMVNLVLE